jgi:hypothetical protein
MRRIFLATLIVLLAIPVLADDTFQINFATNLNLSDSFLDLTNTGATVSAGASQSLCVNVYAFDPAADEIACCTCSVPPNGLASMSVKTSILANTGTSVMPTSVVVKLVASTGTCNASTITVLAHGMAAWMTTTHTLTKTTPSPNYWTPATTTTTATQEETAFTQADLSAAELSHITSTCAFIESNDGGSGICKGCTAGGQ